MFEHRAAPLLPWPTFLVRMLRCLAIGLAGIAISLAMGMAGYHYFESLSWLDAFANAAMILSGMGPLAPLQTNAGKLFAGCYALFSGLAFITIVGFILAPLAHRFLHKFHLDEAAAGTKKNKTKE